MINSILTMKKKITILIFLIAAVGLFGEKGSTLFNIKADHQEYDEDKLIAYDVEVSFEEYRIYADYMEINQKTKELLARGRVTMTSKTTVLTGEKLTFNANDRTGVMYDTYGLMSPSVRYNTERLSQVDDETLTFKKLDFTSCAQCVPRWKITCTGGKIKKEKYIEMKNAVLKIKKIPILYIPYIRYPVDKDGRATGFLFPGIGRSSRRGFFLLNSFFWAMKPNVDLTLSLDYYGNAGIGTGEEFRYLFKNMEGNVKFYFFKYKNSVILGPEDEIPDNNTFYSHNTSDYFLKMTHKQKINFLNTKIIVDIDKQSDANFLRLFSNDFDSVLRRISRSSVSLNSSIANVKFSVNAAIHDTFYTFNNTSRSLRYLPQISLNWNQQKVWKLPGYFSLNTSYSGVQRIGKSYETEETIYTTDIKTQRININPSYSVGLIKSPWLSAKLSLQSKHSLYPRSQDPETGDIVDEPLHLQYHTANVELKGPIFSKIYEFRDGKIKHLLVPEITMRYVTQVDEEDRDRLIPVDNFDYPSYSYVGFSLTSRLLVKKKKSTSAREILSYTVSQDYYFDPAAASRNRQVNGVYPEFSELKNTLRFRPFKYFSLDGSVVYNYYLDAEKFIDNFTRIRVNMAYNNRKSFLYGNFNYSRYINQYARPGYVFNRDTIGGSINFDLPRFPIKLDSKVNYDITAKEFRHGSFKLTYDYQCIRFNAELNLFKYSGRIETRFNLGVSFGNMGLVKDFLGVEDQGKR